MGLSVIGSIFNITGIAVNRYCYICHSFSYSRLYSYRNTMMFVALIWVLTVVAVMPNIFVGSLRYDPRVYSCTFAQNVSSSYTVAVVVVHFFVPIAVVTFCYLRIWVLVIQVSPLLLDLQRRTTGIYGTARLKTNQIYLLFFGFQRASQGSNNNFTDFDL